MKFKLVVTIVILFTLTQFVLAQDFNFIGAGARARGMGGAFIGVADDATAASWNPAGLVRLDRPEASVVGVFESYSISSDIPDFDTDPYNSSHFYLNFISAAFPLSVGERNLVAALAYQRVIDLYDYYDGDDYFMERTGGVNAITPSVGVQLTPAISLGASVNIFTGTTNYTEEDKTGFYEDVENEFNFSGTNFNIGGLFDFNKVRLGVVFKTPFDLTEENADGGFKSTIKMPQMLGFGLAFAATEKLTIAGDYEMRKYSESEIEDEETGESMEMGWEDINQVRLGAEYLYMSGNTVLPLRLGFATTPTLFKDENDDQIVGANLTAGIGLIMGSINLDLGVEYNVYSYEIDAITDTYEYNDNYLRFIIAGVFHFGN
ncbi:MAG: OmpP1/FadL family transporter [Candidatus Zhuqueibacterota bacterium]